MRPLCFILPLLCFLPLLSSNPVKPTCSPTQYSWPYISPTFCCEKCPAGEFMARRSQKNCDHKCEPCEVGKYTAGYNTAMNCEFCNSCSKPNMEVKTECSATHNTVCTCKAGYKCKDQDCNECVSTVKPTVPPSATAKVEVKTDCNPTHNTVCTCKAGYKCKDQDCKECVLIPATVKPTVPPSTTVATPDVSTTRLAPKPIADTVWFLVIIALLCTGIALVVVTKIKPFLVWIRFTHGYFLAEKPATQPACDEEVSKPVQEVCGKCDQPMC
ncbi:tumor necrosis factor receptor superfamily member 1A [Simochromis diagramma]|uniref:tumor necrosis factor receptor superfamily member 1A n=1 Tax=Simochromis diagramma TaxID=43689 RepID=UPI001A7EA77E|nr:tumor necrosis factor receptor superfamily member 1A [Simochromis diagramma]XP_039885986.1 tumor necrosis factor receptor superfamily member 1A [Simochromis diagramma]